MIRIIHTSDIHLGKKKTINTHNASSDSWRSLWELVNLSSQIEASLVIIAGDFFESNRLDSRTVIQAAQDIARFQIPVVILPGNHDCLVSNSVYNRVCLPEIASNVRIFTASEGETFSFPELDIAVWGKPITSYGGDLRPLSGIPPRGPERWQMAAAHGYYVGSQSHHAWNFQISEEEIIASDRDYIALGHWGTFRCVHDYPVKAYYAGSLPSAVAIVELHEFGVFVRPHSLNL